jgi:hypothetical protein
MFQEYSQMLNNCRKSKKPKAKIGSAEHREETMGNDHQ